MSNASASPTVGRAILTTSRFAFAIFSVSQIVGGYLFIARAGVAESLLLAGLAVSAAGFTAVIVMRLYERRRIPAWQKTSAVVLIALALIPAAAGGNPNGSVVLWIFGHLLAALILLQVDLLLFCDLRAALNFAMIFSVATIAFGELAFSVDPRSIVDAGRLTGVFGHPNVTGVAAALAALVNMFGPRRKFRRFFVVVALIVCLLSLSLTAILSLIFGFSVTLVRSVRVRWTAWTFGIVAFFIVPLIVILFDVLLDPIFLTGRAEIWIWLYDVSDISAVGEGLDLFNGHRDYALIPWFHAHNQALMSLVTVGVLGMVLVASLVWILGVHAVRPGGVQFAVWIVLIVHSITEVPIHIDYPGARLFLFVLVAGVIGTNLWNETRHQARQSQSLHYYERAQFGS